MSYQEFDDYLAVLGRMLRLARSQREGIACELRDHLQERLAELSAEGVPQDVAIGKALEEFGDAAVLAAQFIQISRNKRRRWIMRCTMGVTATAVAAVLVAFAVWPGSHPAMPGAAAADPGAAQPQDEPKAVVAAPAADVAAAVETKAEMAIRKALDSPTQMDFHETPLSDVVDYLKDKHRIEIQINKKALDDVGIGTDTPITFRVKGVRLRSALNFLLHELNLSYMIDNSVLLITTPEDVNNKLTQVVYSVEELIAIPGKPEEADFDSLMGLTTTIIEPNTWSESGGPGTIAPFENRGALVVLQNTQVQYKIGRLLNVLRNVRRAKAESQPAGKLQLAPALQLMAESTDAFDKALDSPASLDFVETPLADVVDYLQDRHKIEIQLDKRAMEDVGIGTDTPISKHLTGVTLREALNLMLRQLDLTFQIRDEMLIITTPEAANNQLSVTLYPVGDLVLPPGKTDPTAADFESLIHMITAIVNPNGWAEAGGPASIYAYKNDLLLVVAQTAEGHFEITQLLDNLRKLPAAKTVRVHRTPPGRYAPMGRGGMGGMGMGGMQPGRVRRGAGAAQPAPPATGAPASPPAPKPAATAPKTGSPAPAADPAAPAKESQR